MYKKLIGVGTAVAGLALAAAVVFAAPGDAVQPPIPACVGIGVAYDGTDILYTCAGGASIHKTDLTGIPDVVVPTVDGAGNPLSVDAIAWDSNEGRLWGGDLDGAGNCRIWSIDMATGVGTLRFSFTDPSPLARCSVAFFDGITVDTVTDTIYASPDVTTHIRHFNKDGTPAANDSIDFTGLTAGECPWAAGFGAAGCWNSGLAMGIDGNLFAGTASDGKIYRLDPNVPSSLGVFATVSGRDEDLECGPVVEGKETILSKQLEGPIDVLEAPEGTCQRPEQPKVEVACKETVNPYGKTVPPAGSTTLPGSKGGQNEDGFYELSIVDKFPAGSTLWVTDALGSGPFGPFLPGDKVKITEAPGGTPSIKKIGSTNGLAGAIVAHITLKGDALVFAIDPAGNKFGPVSCLVPPPPK